MAGRATDSEAVIKQRLDSVSIELEYVHNYSYVVINDEVCAAVKKLKAIVTAEKCRVERSQEFLASLHNYKANM